MVGCSLSTLRLKKTLQGAAAPGKPVNYLFLGDLNTMGMEDLFKEYNILPEIELKKIDAIAKKRKMRTLTKSRPHPWSNGSKSRYKPSYLDHVVAADHLQFKQLSAFSAGPRRPHPPRRTLGSNASPTTASFTSRSSAREAAVLWGRGEFSHSFPKSAQRFGKVRVR